MYPDELSTPVERILSATSKGPSRPSPVFLAVEADRARNFGATGPGTTLGVSRQRLSAQTLAQVVSLADEIGLRERIAAMCRGDFINATEPQQALHTALRRPGAPHAKGVLDECGRILTIAENMRSGRIRSSSNQALNWW